MCVIPPKYKLNLPTVTLNNCPMMYVDMYKYLGCLICNDCTDNADIKRQLHSFYAKSNMLLRKFYLCNAEIKKVLYTSYCTNFYCTQLWFNYSSLTISKLRVAFNNGFRKLMNYNRSCSASAMFANNNIQSFDGLRRKCIYNFRERLNNSENTILRDICNSFFMYNSDSNKEWCDKLYMY